MNIHQLSVRYLEEQDRILVRINTTTEEEVRMWITRRFLLGFFPLLSKAVADQTASLQGAATAAVGEEARKMLAEFKQAEVVSRSNMQTPFRAQAQSFPFGASPLLVTGTQIAREQGKLQLNFEEKLNPEHKPRSFRIGLGQELAHGLVHLLERESARAGWLQPAAANAAGSGEAANEGAVPARPKYLN